MFAFPKFNASPTLRIERDALSSQFRTAIKAGEHWKQKYNEMLQQAQEDHISRLYGVFYRNGAQAVLTALRHLAQKQVDPANVFERDRDGDIFFCNAAFRRIFAEGVRNAVQDLMNNQTSRQARWHREWKLNVSEIAEYFINSRGLHE